MKVARTEIIPVGNTKFWELVNKGLVELAYVDGIPFAVTASLLRLIDESPQFRAAGEAASLAPAVDNPLDPGRRSEISKHSASTHSHTIRATGPPVHK